MLHVIGEFPDRASAELAARDLRADGFDAAGIRLDLPPSDAAGARAVTLLIVDAGERSDDARLLMRKNNAINLQDVGEVVPYTPVAGAAPTGTFDAAARGQASGAAVPPPLTSLGGLNAAGADMSAPHGEAPGDAVIGRDPAASSDAASTAEGQEAPVDDAEASMTPPLDEQRRPHERDVKFAHGGPMPIYGGGLTEFTRDTFILPGEEDDDAGQP